MAQWKKKSVQISSFPLRTHQSGILLLFFLYVFLLGALGVIAVLEYLNEWHSCYLVAVPLLSAKQISLKLVMGMRWLNTYWFVTIRVGSIIGVAICNTLTTLTRKVLNFYHSLLLDTKLDGLKWGQFKVPLQKINKCKWMFIVRNFFVVFSDASFFLLNNIAAQDWSADQLRRNHFYVILGWNFRLVL